MINLDYLCVAMIYNIKGLLMESDFSMCLASLLNYPEQQNAESLLKLAIKIKDRVNSPNFGKQTEII